MDSETTDAKIEKDFKINWKSLISDLRAWGGIKYIYGLFATIILLLCSPEVKIVLAPIALYGFMLLDNINKKKTRLNTIILVVLLILLAAYVLIQFRFTQDVSIVLAGTLALAAIWQLVKSKQEKDQLYKKWIQIKSIGLLILSFITYLYPIPVLNLIIILSGIMCVIILTAIISNILKGEKPQTEHSENSFLLTWISHNSSKLVSRDAVIGKLIFSGENVFSQLSAFFMLMGFASIIASLGIVGDSTAVVVGAMLIAPLMTPLLGIAFSLAMGWPHRLLRMGLIALVGVVLTIIIGFVIGSIFASSIDVDNNSQILSRVSPTLVDLLIAIAAGAAGAYGISRSDISDSLPGVAISIALVPPLAVVGICFSKEEWLMGLGSLTLFTTNAIAIFIFGGLVFVLTGIAPIDRLRNMDYQGKILILTVVTISLIIFGLLSFNSSNITQNILTDQIINQVGEDWIKENKDHRLVSITSKGNEIQAIIAGPKEDAPTAKQLSKMLEDQLNQPTPVTLRLVIENETSYNPNS